MVYPLIISAPHACSVIEDAKMRSRIRLTDYEIWQMSDPFTDVTAKHPRAFAHHIGQSHRILGDLNRDRDANKAFRKTDFYGRQIWKKDKILSKKEKEDFLKLEWDGFREGIKESFMQMQKEGYKKVLFIDHHNTSADHPAGKEAQYMPPIMIANLGKENTGLKDECALSSSVEVTQSFYSFLEKEFPYLSIELNTIYKGSNTIRWITKEVQTQVPELEICALLLEYNLGFIYNPISRKKDREAETKLTKGINQAISNLIEVHFF